MMIVPVLANLGPLEELTFKPNPEEVCSLLIYFYKKVDPFGKKIPFLQAIGKVLGLFMPLRHMVKRRSAILGSNKYPSTLIYDLHEYSRVKETKGNVIALNW